VCSGENIHPSIRFLLWIHDTRALPKALYNVQSPGRCACKDCELRGFYVRCMHLMVYVGAVRELTWGHPLREDYKLRMCRVFQRYADMGPWVKKTHEYLVQAGIESEGTCIDITSVYTKPVLHTYTHTSTY
jgi:hypothetical protein